MTHQRRRLPREPNWWSSISEENWSNWRWRGVSGRVSAISGELCIAIRSERNTDISFLEKRLSYGPLSLLQSIGYNGHFGPFVYIGTYNYFLVGGVSRRQSSRRQSGFFTRTDSCSRPIIGPLIGNNVGHYSSSWKLSLDFCEIFWLFLLCMWWYWVQHLLLENANVKI